MAKREESYRKMVAQNRRARYDYFIEETIEAGIVLTGAEVKSIRINGANINDSYATVENGELILINSHITEYSKASAFNKFEAKRNRKLLVKKREIKKFIGLTQKKGFSLVPLELYFNKKNLVKITLAVVKGKKEYDKREAIKQAEWKREKARIE